jgi:cation:H+ antiporter
MRGRQTLSERSEEFADMSITSSAALFLGSLFLTALASAVLSKRLDQVGAWLGFSAGLTGLVTALAADSPEIASAVIAQMRGRHDLGIGVIFGSNIFNLASLLG